MSKFRVRWMQTVTEHWYIEVEAKNEAEAKQKWMDDLYHDEEGVLDDSTVECTDFDAVEKVKSNEVAYHCDRCDYVISKREYKANQGLCDNCIDDIN